MIIQEDVLKIIKDEIRRLNEDLDYESLEHVDNSTLIFGGFDSIDSLSLIQLLTSIEKSIQNTVGIEISLADEEAMARKISPYENVQNLLDFALERINQVNN